MSSGRKGKNNIQPNVYGNCLYRTYNARFSVNLYANYCVLQPFDKQQLSHYKNLFKHVNHENLQNNKESPQLFFNSIYEKFTHMRQRYLADIEF